MEQIPLIKYQHTLVHRDVLPHLQHLQSKATKAGIFLTIASGYRSIERQLQIWNEKCQGKRAVLDAQSKPLLIENMTRSELLFAILRWSALPGFSRHHWGTDFDVFDKNALPTNYDLQLIPQEYAIPNGIFAHLSEWLQHATGDFFFPYRQEQQGVAPEPWHISFAPVAQKYFKQLSLNNFIQQISELDIELKAEILQHAPEIFERFVINISPV